MGASIRKRTYRVDAAICKEVLKTNSPDHLQATSVQIVKGQEELGNDVKGHHTKVKADVGLGKVIADLVIKGYIPCIPLSEHQPYDLLAVLPDGKVIKLQVKYAQLKKNGVIDIKFKTSWADKNGIHSRAYQKEDFDYYAVYCPQKEQVLYIPNTPHCPKAVRFEKPANNQNKFVKWAKDYLEIQRESSETIRRTPEMVKT